MVKLLIYVQVIALMVVHVSHQHLIISTVHVQVDTLAQHANISWVHVLQIHVLTEEHAYQELFQDSTLVHV